MVTNPTRRRDGQKPSLVDLVLVNDENFISDIIHLAPSGKSDHEILSFKFYIGKPIHSEEQNYKYDLGKGNYVDMRKDLMNVDWGGLENKTVNEYWTFMKTKILESMEKYIPKTVVKLNKTPKPCWMSGKVKKSVKKKYNLYKKFLKTRTIYDHQKYVIARNECNKIIKEAKKEYEKRLSKECKTNTKYFWKYVQSKTKINTGVSPLETLNGKLAVSDEDKAKTLNDFFASVFTKENSNDIPTMKIKDKSNSSFLTDIVITPTAVKNKLQMLNPSKAQGPDQIPPRVLKELSNELSTPFCVLFNKSIEIGEVPDDWKTAVVTAIFKKGTRSDPSNYRPVSLTCVTCKVLESLLRDVLVDYMSKNNLYSQCQHGFRKHRSCITQLLEVMEDLTKFLEEKESIDIIYLDFKKAFDSVPHLRLLSKLESYGITGNVSRWIQAFLSKRLQRVRVGKCLSPDAEVLSGIPQGSILGPILFTIFINDLPECVSSCCKIFADDTKLYDKATNSTKLQSDINSLLNWSNKWNLYFNATKCNVLHLGKNNPKHNYIMESSNSFNIISKCEEEKDLGVIFDKKFSFDAHIQAAINKANKMLGIIKRTFTFMDKYIFINLYKTIVRPILEYGNIVWYPRLKRQSIALERVQRRATKMIPELRDLDYQSRLEHLKLHTLKYRRYRGDMIQVFKIINKIDDINPNTFFSTNKANVTRNSNINLYTPFCKTNVRKFSFSTRAVKGWNALTSTTKLANDINQFKNLLDSDPKTLIKKSDFDV